MAQQMGTRIVRDSQLVHLRHDVTRLPGTWNRIALTEDVIGQDDNVSLVYQVDVIKPPSQLALAQRTLQISLAAVRFALSLGVRELDGAIMGVKNGKNRSAQDLQELLTRLGPTFVKLAQTLSMRPDLLGDVYIAALSKLQDNVSPFPNSIAFELLEKELGRPLGEIFEFLSPEPVASASIGQVYRGVLRPELGGHSVAVKVQRPGAAESIALDVFLLRQFIGIVQRMAGITRDLGALADEVGSGLRGECDFRNEVANAMEFSKAHAELDFITVPRMMTRLCTRRVLVSEWVDGRSPTQLLASGDAGTADVLALVRKGIQCSLAQLLVTGCMHGDPHSGNLLLARDGKLCYLDFGLIVRVPPEDRQAMMAALVHIGLGEWTRLVQDLDALGLLKPNTDRHQLAKELQQEFEAVLSSSTGTDEKSRATKLPLLSLQTSNLSFSTLAKVLFKTAFKFRFLLPNYFPLVIRAVASLEGVALTVDPEFKLVAAGMPVVLNQLLSDRRPAAQALLRELLLAPGGALRTDETTRQILQVWLSAGQQAARSEALGRHAAMGTHMKKGSTTAIDMTGLLLAPKNVPLRRTLMVANPAATIAQMPPDMRDQLLVAVKEALSADGASAVAQGVLRNTPAGRAQRKRLWMLLKASVPKVLRSPPRSIFQLVTFTVAIVGAVIAALVKKVVGQLKAIWQRNSQPCIRQDSDGGVPL